jgi:hypothetical protein
METVASKIKSFNSIVESILAQTSGIVGTSYYHYFTKLVKVNAVLPIQYATIHMLKYKKEIMEKDVAYFETKTNDIHTFTNQDDYKKVNELFSREFGGNDYDMLGQILRLKEIYYQLDNESKENIWAILQALVQLTIEYCELKNIPIEY